MKKFIIAAVAASLIGTPAMAAQSHYGNGHRAPAAHQGFNKHGPNYRQPARHQYRDNWKRGDRFDQRYARNYRQIDYRAYNRMQPNKRFHLKAPPRGYHYVQSGNDIVMVAITTGIIASIFAGMAR